MIPNLGKWLGYLWNLQLVVIRLASEHPEMKVLVGAKNYAPIE